jgi:NADH-quinone oxidoreductase subunit K
VIILSIELILFAIILNLLSYSGYFDDLISQLFILFILVIAAAESVIGLSLTVSVYRLRGSLDINVYTVLKG